MGLSPHTNGFSQDKGHQLPFMSETEPAGVKDAEKEQPGMGIRVVLTKVLEAQALVWAHHSCCAASLGLYSCFSFSRACLAPDISCLSLSLDVPGLLVDGCLMLERRGLWSRDSGDFRDGFWVWHHLSLFHVSRQWLYSVSQCLHAQRGLVLVKECWTSTQKGRNCCCGSGCGGF